MTIPLESMLGSASPEEIYGDFQRNLKGCNDFLTLNFTLSDEQRLQRWSNYGLSADFLGDYFASFFPGTCLDGEQISLREEVKSVVSFVSNELLENAVKYGRHSLASPVTITLRLFGDMIIFEATNPSTAEHVMGYRAFVQQLVSGDPAELYFRQLEQTAAGTGQSHMGILTMINDYQARFGWRFAPMPPEAESIQGNTAEIPWLVSVMVCLSVGSR
jgi:hypothetical protein